MWQNIFQNFRRYYMSSIPLLVILVIGFTYIAYSNAANKSAIDDILKDSIARDIITLSSSLNDEVEFVKLSGRMTALNTDTDKHLMEVVEAIKGHMYDEVMIVNTLGVGTNTVGENVDIQNMDFFKKAVSGESVLSSYGQGMLMIAVPIIDENAQVSGVLCTVLGSKSLENLYTGIGDAYDGHTYLLAGENVYSKDAISSGEIQKVYEVIQSDLKDGDVFYEYSYDGEDNHLAFEYVTGSDLIIVSTAAKDSVVKQVRWTMVTNEGIVFIILFVLLAFSYHIMRLTSTIKTQEKKTGFAIKAAKLMIVKIDNNNIIRDVNDIFLLLSGYNKEELLNKDFLELLPELETDLKDEIADKMKEVTAKAIDIPVIRHSGDILYIHWNVSRSDSGVIELYGSDVTELKESQQRFNKLAYYDTLTGIYNKIFLEEYVVAHTKSKDEKFAFIFIDLDNFKYINDAFGHALGDRILKLVVQRIIEYNSFFPPEKIKLFRIGGDEMVVVYHDFYDYGEVGDYSNIVLNRINEKYNFENAKFTISASIGLTFFPENAEDFAGLFKTSEIAMNNAKERGKSRVSFFSTTMSKRLEHMVSIMADLEDAFKRNEFVLYYQPQYDINTGELYGYEALMRWFSPTRGFVSPGEFIHYAEKNGIINELGMWALKEASKFANEIEKSGYKNVKISINVSSVQMLDEDFVSKVLQVVNETKVNVSNIHLEITESVMMESIDASLIKLNQLHQEGIMFSLDDFGTGYSSLTYIRKLPIEVLKIDKSFVDTILEDGSDKKELLTAIINLAKAVDLKIVAEGVEEKVQWEWLREKGCDVCQGYYTGRPLPKAEAVAHLGKNVYESLINN